MSASAPPISPFGFHKMEATGNDFVVVYRQDLPAGAEPSWAKQLCDRHFGIGADGVLIIDHQRGADVVAAMEVWNADGSVPEMCGNGFRCVARRLEEDGRITLTDRARIATGAGPRQASFVGDDVQVEIGRPRIAELRRRITVDGEDFVGAFVSMGNPHFVLFGALQPSGTLPDFERWGERLEHADAFPQRSNIEFVELLADDHLRLRVWERGVGETLACGTGACAAAAAARASGLCEHDEIAVDLPGGRLRVSWSGDHQQPTKLRGPARTVYQGTWRG